ncbi:acyltransferase family protein, partial [Morganella morganii]|uniref:acyltransferase family protein n=1 Tax=Morganella morganii TaxID=582 RepID=UPI001119D5FE
MKMTRNYSIDLLRVFCCVLVIGIHVVPTYSPPYNINANNVQIIIMQSIVRVGLPVFFILSGMFLLNNKYS